jgi:hypothetical protein
MGSCLSQCFDNEDNHHHCYYIKPLTQPYGQYVFNNHQYYYDGNNKRINYGGIIYELPPPYNPEYYNSD